MFISKLKGSLQFFFCYMYFRPSYTIINSVGRDLSHDQLPISAASPSCDINKSVSMLKDPFQSGCGDFAGYFSATHHKTVTELMISE